MDENKTVSLTEILGVLKKQSEGSEAITKADAPAPAHFEELLIKSCAMNGAKYDDVKRALYPVFKTVGTVDINAVRITSLYPLISQSRNRETKFLNMLEASGPIRVRDYQVRIPEEDIGSDTVQLFNMDTTSTLDAAQSVLSSRTNTLTAIGNSINITFMASALSEQGPYTRDEANAQLDMQNTRMRRRMNALLLANTEQVSEALPNVPQLGGFITRSTANNQAVGGGNLTDALISGRTNAIAGTFGFDDIELVGITNAAQIAVIRDLMINRYPGTDPMSKFNYDSVLARRLASVGVEVQMVYEDDHGKVIPFIRDTQDSSGTTVIFDPNRPKLGLFQMMGAFGPWTLERPNTSLAQLLYIWNLFTLIDPTINSRSLLTGHS